MKGLYKIFALLFVVMLCGCSHSDDEAILKQKGELIISLNAPVEIGVEQTRAELGDGKTFDGGGMEDLVLVLIDEGDRVVSKKTFTFNGSVWSSPDAIIDSNVENKSITTSFTDLDVAKYTVFAYANVNNSLPYFGDIKSKLDAVTVGGTFALEDATFDVLGNAGSTTTPTVNSTNPMLLTARELVEIEVGANTAVVEMKRPLVEFNFKVVNHSSKQLNITNLEFKNFNPQTSYITPHDAIYAEDATNIYRELPPSGFSNTTPAVIDATEEEVIYKTYLYENTSATDRYQFDISLALPGAVYETTQLVINEHNNAFNTTDKYLLKNGNYFLMVNGDNLTLVQESALNATNITNAEFKFSGTTNGNLYNVGTEKRFYRNTKADTSVSDLTFNHRGNGVYRIYYTTSSYWGSTTYYLRTNSNSVLYDDDTNNSNWQLYTSGLKTVTTTVDPLTASNQQISYIQDNGVAAPLKEMLRNQKITVTLNVYFEETSGIFRFYVEQWNDGSNGTPDHNNGATFD